ncbi:uncharacterized protein LOC115428969 [Sphaeramia orbicularis]|uniref:uncharacterized protein LOC115428969 n=1 Tax=Sphaeramia orbicularis TaxID=375764 RepID=UPI00117C741A|nr:uncharacterized protein LOC115428969 [Sphaeramia orbicularis]
MMGFVQVAVFVLGLLSVGHSAPVTSCETLTQQLDVPTIDPLLGKWIYQADVTTVPGSKLLTKLLVKNVWAEVTKANESNSINTFHAQRTLGRCFSLNIKQTLKNNTLFMSYPYEASQILLKTSCPDCLVFLGNFSMRGNSYRGLQLISRRRTLTPAEVEEFKKQAECLNLPAPVFIDAETDLCPDGSVTQDTESETTDLTSLITREAINETFTLFDTITSSQDKLQEFVKLLSSAIIPA